MHVTTQMDLKNMLSERSRNPKSTYCIIPVIWNVQNREIYREKKQVSGCQAMGGRGVTA